MTTDDLTTPVPVPGWMWQAARWLMAVLGFGAVSTLVVLVNAAIGMNGRLSAVERDKQAHESAVSQVRVEVQESLSELKAEVRTVNTNVTALQREFDRKFGATP